MQLLELPNEIIIDALVNAGAASVRTCERTNRTFRDIILQSIELQYLLALEKAGMNDNPECKRSIHERLELLTRREEAWATFKYNFRTTITVPQRSSGLYDTSCGSLFLSFREDPQAKSNGIQYARLPSMQNEQPAWQNIRVGRTTRVLEFVTSVREHDLIALVVSTPSVTNPNTSNINVIFIRYSTGEYHDIPEKHTLHICSVEEEHGNPYVALEIVGENIIIAFAFGDPHGMHNRNFFVFKWKAGAQIFPVPSTQDIGVVFLREDIFFIPNSLLNSIDIYQIPNSTDKLMKRIQRLHLPSLKPGVSIELFECRSEPNCRGDHQSFNNVSSSQSFYENPEKAIIIFSMNFDDRSFIMITHRSSILNLALQMEAPGYLRWESWGPPVCRWFHTEPHETMFITITSGQRLLLYPGKGSSTQAPIYILDFNPYRVHLERQKRRLTTKKSMFSLFRKAASLRPDSANCVTELVDTKEDNFCNASGCFLTRIYSELPYVQCCSSETFDYHTLMMDDERIIGTWCKVGECVRGEVEVLHMG